MNHKFEKNDTDSFNWDLAIMLIELELICIIEFERLIIDIH